MLFILQLVLGFLFLYTIFTLLGFYYIIRKTPDKEGYIYLNRRDIVFMIIFFPITICSFISFKVITLKEKVLNKKKKKKVHNWWSKPIKKL